MKLQALAPESHTTALEDHSCADYRFQDGHVLSIYAGGYYTVAELQEKLRQLVEATRIHAESQIERSNITPMSYLDFCKAVGAILAHKPPRTGLVCGGGALVMDGDSVLAVPMNNDGTFQSMAEAYDTDAGEWNDEFGAWDGMTAAQCADSLANPVFRLIEIGTAE